MSSHLLADFWNIHRSLGEGGRKSPELYRHKTNGEIAEGEGPALALGRPRLEGLGEPGHVARLRSVGCRAGAASELRRGRFNRKGEARMRFARFDGRGKTAGSYCPASFCRMPRRRGTGTTPWQI